jgi:hypothetical protein
MDPVFANHLRAVAEAVAGAHNRALEKLPVLSRPRWLTPLTPDEVEAHLHHELLMAWTRMCLAEDLYGWVPCMRLAAAALAREIEQERQG